jgi:hypothetical protein
VTDQNMNPIQAAPSVDDLLALGTDSRVGQVDFANRLVAVPDLHSEEPTAPSAAPAPKPAPKPAAAVPARRVVQAVPEPEDTSLDDLFEPRVDDEIEAAPEAEAEVEVEAEAEAEVAPEVEVAPEPVLVAPEPAKPAARTRKPAAKTAKPKTAAAKEPAKPAARKPATKKPQARNHPSMTKPTRTKPALEPAPKQPSVAPPIMPIANLSGDAVAETPTTSPVETTVSQAALIEPAYAAAATTLRLPVEQSEPVAVPRQQPRTPSAESAVEDSSYLGATVQAVADAAIERLRDAENATLQHLAALEAEAARRAELLTAQAELDAELIRITARREAHAIISAARSQAGLGAPTTQANRDSRQLAEISDAVSRFAESIESSLAPYHADREDA